MINTRGAYALYEFLKGLVEDGKLKKKNDNSEIYFIDGGGFIHPIDDYAFDDNHELVLWE